MNSYHLAILQATNNGQFPELGDTTTPKQFYQIAITQF